MVCWGEMGGVWCAGVKWAGCDSLGLRGRGVMC